MGGLRLAVAFLQDERAGIVQHAHLVGGNRGCVSPGVEAIAGCLATEQLDAGIIDERGEGSDGVGTATHAGHDDVGQASLGGEQLCARLVADNTLKVAHQLRERVRAGGRTKDVVGRLHVGHPVAEGLVDRVLEGRRSSRHGDNFGSEHLHARDVQRLALGVLTSHVDRAVESKESSCGRGGHAVLASAGLGDDTRLAQLLGEQGLTEHVVDLVRARVVQVLALQEHAHTAQVGCETRCLSQQRGTSGVVQEQVAQTALERLVAPQALPRGLNLFEGAHEGLGDETSTEITEVRSLRKVLGNHHCPS